ncbi:MAG: GNAT family N-acetyltransferase [Burkholderiales bacterium]|nr:GNAT family N-acetyltransferase [Burkholderiales bacterium]
MSDTAIIRPYLPADAAPMGQLLEALGYEPVDGPTMQARVERFAAVGRSALLVAELQGRVVGWIHMAEAPTLISDGYAEVLALMVDTRVQRQGIGRRLLAAGEAWVAQALGSGCIRLRSGVHRAEAHKFYEQMGYQVLRASYLFEKHVVPAISERQVHDVQPAT